MDLILILVILIYSAILHEIAHGLVAERLGDPTARLMGRITLNPIPHIDPYMSILLPLILYLSPAHIIIGGAKPVPVDPFNLRDGRKDMAIVSLAGPATNFSIAIILGIACHFLFPGFSLDFIMQSSIIGFILGGIVYVNILLGIFNLLPIPPLDGSKIFALILPEKEANTYLSIGSIGILIVFILFMFPIGGFSLGNVIGNLLTFSEHLLGL
jgi:Zn-dependent protease